MSHDHPSSLESLNAHEPLMIREGGRRYRVAEQGEILQAAQRLLLSRVRGSDPLSSPADVRDFLRMRLGALDHEVFSVLFLDAQHHVLDYVEMFRGTLTQTSVYPREVVKAALSSNAGAVVLVHNHPSGLAEPSRADELLTQTLKTALALVDVRVLDHVVVTAAQIVSFAERGLL